MQAIRDGKHFAESLEVKQSNAKPRKMLCWIKPWRRGPFWRECSSHLIYHPAEAKKESKHCIFCISPGPNWQSQAQSSTQQVTLSVTCRDLCAQQVYILLDICLEVLRAAPKAGAHGVSVHTGVQTWARDSYLTWTFYCVCRMCLFFEFLLSSCLWSAGLLDLPLQTPKGSLNS